MESILRARSLVRLLGFVALLGCSRTKTTMSAQAPAPKHVVTSPPSAVLPPSPAPASTVLNLPKTTWTAEQQAHHVLDRLAYGPRPGEVESLAKSGVEPWIRAQLAPASIDDHAVDAELAKLPTLAMSIGDLRDDYPKPKASGKGEGKSEHRPAQILRELSAAKIIRAVDSERQLQEVLVDFWFNHFNVDAQKGLDKWMIGAYERDAIRPFVFGKFRDMLGATASHPAMLFYLDNWLSSREMGDTKGGAKREGVGDEDSREYRGRSPRSRKGLNENYGRELLELHTLGVDGGYSQDDVRTAARAFTGWTIDRDEGTFVFRPKMHDEGELTLLGTKIAGAGKADGEKVLDLVARHPSTARFIARKLCVKFVSDDPPQALVDRVAKVFTESDGDLSKTYRAIFESPEFWGGSKVKTPLELTASAMRAVGAKPNVHVALGPTLTALGQPLYHCPPPTGFAEASSAWVNGGALVSRINFGLDLAAGRIHGVHLDRDALFPGKIPQDDGALVDALAKKLFHAPLSSATRSTLLAELGDDDTLDDQARVARALGLLLGSPEFQKQ